jgi:hypothetical protein
MSRMNTPPMIDSKVHPVLVFRVVSQQLIACPRRLAVSAGGMGYRRDNF